MTTNQARIARYGLSVCTLALSGFLLLHSAESPREHVGPLPDGGFLLNSGWMLHPAGQQVPVGTFPISTALSANGKFLAVLNAGYDPPSISIIDAASQKEVGRTSVPDGWLGLAFASGTNRLFVGGGASGKVFELSLNPDSGALTNTHEYAAVADLANKGKAFIGDVALDSKAHLLYAADLYDDKISVINLQSGTLIAQWPCGRRPYRILVAPGDTELFVSSWSDASVYQYNANSGQQIARVRSGAHATDMLLLMKPAPAESGQSSYIGRLFVTAGNTNSVYSYGVAHDGQLTQLEAINISLSPMHPLGMTPSALAVNKEGSKLYVVCSDANAVAVADISGPQTTVEGFVPTAWYPTAVRSLDDGQLVVLNGKGLGSHPNPDGPQPTKSNHALYQGGPVVSPGYVGHTQTGTVGFIAPWEPEKLDEYSRTVLTNSPYRDEILANPITSDQVAQFAAMPNHPSPIQHVIYIIKENRTYDQVLGDVAQGNGDKSLVLFGEQVTPNLHQLAHDYILYDNFYENADVSAEGHNWANAAIAPDYTVRTWPASYAGRRKGYDYEGTEAANSPPAGYIWDNVLQAGLTVRDYGEWDEVKNSKEVKDDDDQIKSIQDPALNGHVDRKYRGWDLGYQDVDRAREFVREWKNFDAKGSAPNFMVVRLGNDHTEGLKAGALTPFAHVADNDHAVGMLVDGVSHSKLWASTAIFVIEDDAQNGPDHVDSHRAPAFVISPYTRRGIVDSTMYNQMSILRTIELILGLRPMTHYDAGARPMFGGFAKQADTTPFTAIEPKVSITERNPVTGSGAADSARMDFSQPDKVDDEELTAVLWRGVKHADPPAPTHSGFAH